MDTKTNREVFPHFDNWFEDLKAADSYGIITDSAKESYWGHYINELTPQEAYSEILDAYGVE